MIAWTVPVLTSWAKFKPVLRSAIVAWICLLLMVIEPIERQLGNASFLLLVGVFIQPCELPVVAVIEREMFTLGLLLIAWAWSCLGTAIAVQARTYQLAPTEAALASIFSGDYIQGAEAVICGFFLSIGAAALLYLKVRFGPSPFLFAAILSCICLDVALGYQPLFPYPDYMLATTIIKPLALKAAVNIVVALFFFPKSVNSSFADKLVAVLAPMRDAARSQIELLQQSPLDPDFNFTQVHDLMTKSEGGILALVGAGRLLTREVSFGVASGQDLSSLIALVRALMSPMDGMAYYYRLIRADMKHDRFPQLCQQPGFEDESHGQRSRPASRAPSRPGTPGIDGPQPFQDVSHVDKAAQRPSSLAPFAAREKGSSSTSTPRSSQDSSGNIRQAHHGAFLPRIAHLHLPRSRHHSPEPAPRVGAWEALRYAAIETQLHREAHNKFTEQCTRLLGETTSELLAAQADALDHILSWLANLNRTRLALLRRRVLGKVIGGLPSADAEKRKSSQEVLGSLSSALERFHTARLALIEPFRATIECTGSPEERPPHRYLYQGFVFQFHTARFGERLVTLLEAIVKMEERQDAIGGRFWLPSLPHIFSAEAWHSEGTADGEHGHDDEDPAHMGPDHSSMLGRTKRRDPDALEPQGAIQQIGTRASTFLHTLGRGNMLFCLKAAAVTALLSLPQFMRSSARFCYVNKAVWSLFMAQLTLARHRGEVAFGLVSRLIATTAGAAMGLVIWYIAAPTGYHASSPYTLMVTAAIAFPIVMLVRLNAPGPPITSIITCVTVALVLGYSLKDSTNPTFGFRGVGWTVAWRRFVGVLIGTGAALVMAILPPSSTLRKYQRLGHAATISELCQLYCDVVAYASAPHHPDRSPTELTKRLLATRSKLRRLALTRSVVTYEFSLRGKWPVKRYEELSAVAMELSKLLSHAVTVTEKLGEGYSAALLRKTRFLDPGFLADCISVLSLCATALRSGEPLPQVMPVLMDRLLVRGTSYELTDVSDEGKDASPNVAASEMHTAESIVGDASPPAHDAYRLPKHVDMATLQSEQYQAFAVGMTIAFGIVLRIDKLCMATKALVGESYPVPADWSSGRTHYASSNPPHRS
ncbi:Predicted membrane protein [Ceraceosorus bombacis]|uniref:Predicted membrane protein n=1 Tax=Ceraceosorus bombacis TaxID=401625 RepID=A0A0P1BKV2_9BASI|nr:Predicted membrane protein [Ceraceosorus bombacis]